MQRGIGGQWSYCERNNFAGPMLRGGERVTVPLHYTVLFLLGKAEQETLEQEDRLKADLPAPSDEIQLTFSTLVSGVIVGRKEQLGYYAKGENLPSCPSDEMQSTFSTLVRPQRALRAAARQGRTHSELQSVSFLNVANLLNQILLKEMHVKQSKKLTSGR